MAKHKQKTFIKQVFFIQKSEGSDIVDYINMTTNQQELLQEIFQSLEQGQVIKPESTFHYSLKSIFNK